ncbi:hypothetical protein L7F22_031855 [Adiantum nelumboides]|nr:hypothetical protein [Adiantum nelumboides]
MRMQQLDVHCETKTKDNVFVTMVASIQYRVVDKHAKEAYNKLFRPQDQIHAYFFDVVRSSVPRMGLDDVFEKNNNIAKAVEKELAMNTYGYQIVQTLIVVIIPNQTVKRQ